MFSVVPAGVMEKSSEPGNSCHGCCGCCGGCDLPASATLKTDQRLRPPRPRAIKEMRKTPKRRGMQQQQ